MRSKGALERFADFYNRWGLHNTALYKTLKVEYAGSLAESGAYLPTANEAARCIDVADYAFSENGQAFSTVTALLNLYDDIKPFAQYANRRGLHRLEELYGLDPLPLYNLDDEGVKLANRLFDGMGESGLRFEIKRDFVRILNEIKDESLLGPNTGAYFAILRFWTGSTLQEIIAADPAGARHDRLIGYAQAMKKLVRQLFDRYLVSENEQRRERIRDVTDRSFLLFLRICLAVLLDGSYGRGEFGLELDAAVRLMSDEICGTVRSRVRDLLENLPADSWVTERLNSLSSYRLIAYLMEESGGYVIRYRYYRKKFVQLGDAYGDCTASKASRQLNTEATNIHWTVYAWLLNPYYRVLEICSERGGGLLKAHITPLIVEGRKILMVDAIECVPKLRPEVRGVDNKFFDAELFARDGQRIFDALMERAVDIGRRLGAEGVYADMYSNAAWINRFLSRYPTDSYHTDNVELTFDGDCIADNIGLILEHLGAREPQEDVRVEIQAINLNLMDQYTKSGYKEAAVLDGLKSDWKLKLRGV